jgi:ribulose-bisphosphate carboxylase large chain
VALEACVQARNEGPSPGEGRARRSSPSRPAQPELKIAMETWKEIKFEFDTVDKLDVSHK